MKRLLLSLVCCSPLLLTPTESLSVDLTGPNNETLTTFEEYGPVNQAETLWGISSKLRPNTSVSVQQTLIAIYKSNPYAFFKGDINRIIPQSMLNVPTVDFITQQKDNEAAALIRKYNPKKKPVAKTKKIEPPVQNEIPVVVEKVSPTVIAENQKNIENLQLANNKLSELQAEMGLLEEQFIVATEETRALKLKIQPLTDDIALLSEQLLEDASTQDKLQKVIDDLRTQLSAVEEPPFNGDGLLNNILRFITSTMTNLLVVIISPILLLLIIFALITRIRTKRQLAVQEQELAESTSTLMQESGKFDELLTEDFSNSDDEELDFGMESEAVEPITDEEPLLADLQDLDVIDEQPSNMVDLSEDEELISSIDLDVDVQTDDDDPFGIAALTEESSDVASIDLDEDELVSTEDDPFGIGALVDDELISSDDIEASDVVSESEQADLDLAAQWEAQVAEEADTDDIEESKVISEAEQADLDLATQWEAQVAEDEDASDDIEESKVISEAEQADLDLAAQWEAQVAEDEDASDDIEESEVISEAEQADLDLAAQWEAQVADEEDPTKIDDVLDAIEDVEILEEDKVSEIEIDSEDVTLELDDLETLAKNEVPELEIDNEDSILDLDDLERLSENEASELEIDIEDTVLDFDDLETLTNKEVEEVEIDNADTTLNLDDLESLSESEISNLDIQEEDSPQKEDDLLAQQLSEIAFNEDVQLPKIDSKVEDDFIDIETLLDNSDSEIDEPYSELELDLGLEEFPDVVDLQESVDIDDDENGIGAQLDLARAYLEIDDQAGAKEILMSVIDDSNGAQRLEIDKLLSRLK